MLCEGKAATGQRNVPGGGSSQSSRVREVPRPPVCAAVRRRTGSRRHVGRGLPQQTASVIPIWGVERLEDPTARRPCRGVSRYWGSGAKVTEETSRDLWSSRATKKESVPSKGRRARLELLGQDLEHERSFPGAPETLSVADLA
ncbi:hypothetical protein NDU88_003497 [Pleurodeles waltl]|uniref:Uncharacterized protein n=1 Tax=Pleurodeles waltl TaxID=8319 RepID=A0AAV7W3R0_PLEWA|nr:hypothetical protein NDU88_003497 [Pleurodeles waltl]